MERRNCQEVIKQMLELIPETKTEFIKDLKWNFDDAGYKAPEETIQWQRTMQTLEKHMPDPKESWEWKVLSVFTTKNVELLKKQFENENK